MWYLFQTSSYLVLNEVQPSFYFGIQCRRFILSWLLKLKITCISLNEEIRILRSCQLPRICRFFFPFLVFIAHSPQCATLKIAFDWTEAAYAEPCEGLEGACWSPEQCRKAIVMQKKKKDKPRSALETQYMIDSTYLHHFNEMFIFKSPL